MGGFDFSNHNRNAALHAQGVPLPKATSTGTTIVGCLFDGGVVIAADTRATSGPIVADKVCYIPNRPTQARITSQQSVRALVTNI
jgi:20S proteasome subunit beta 2